MVHPLERIHPRNLKTLAHHVQQLLERRLWAKILVGMLLGLRRQLGTDVLTDESAS